MQIRIERAHAATPEARELVHELEQALAGLYDNDQRHGLSLDVLFEPGVRFFVAALDAMPAGCGGFALLDDHAEVKRMYTRPFARGTSPIGPHRSGSARGWGGSVVPRDRRISTSGDPALRAQRLPPLRTLRPIRRDAGPRNRLEPVL